MAQFFGIYSKIKKEYRFVFFPQSFSKKAKCFSNLSFLKLGLSNSEMTKLLFFVIIDLFFATFIQ
ncbi:hypothetical protein DHD05_20730 [Arenibacter sp. N53]|nr:hypothetical protein [Arenibacter sp. N53]